MRNKTELRTELRRARAAMPEAEVAAYSKRIVTRLEKLVAAANPQTVHCYEPIAGLHEVDVGPFIDFLETKNIQVHTSRYIAGKWQIAALRGGQPTGGSVRYDCIIVPMLGFDGRLHRMGQGGGYYDRLLGGQPRAFKLGACFESGKLPELPNEPHDIALDTIVTEAHIYQL